MLGKRFTLLELTDLALRVPEIGAVNFNILHTILSTLIIELELDGLKPPCFIQDETIAQAAITKARLEYPDRKRRSSKIFDREEMKGRLKVLMSEEDPIPNVMRDVLAQVAMEEGKNVTEEDPIPNVMRDGLAQVALEEGENVTEEDPIPNVMRDGLAQVALEEGKNVTEEDPIPNVMRDGLAQVALEEGENVTEEDPIPNVMQDVLAQVELEEGKIVTEEDPIPNVMRDGLTQVALEEDLGKKETTPLSESEEYVSDEEGSDFEYSEDEGEIPFEEMTVGELQETAKELLEHSADIFAEKAAAVTDALKILEDEELLDAEPARVMEEVWRATNINRRMEAAEEGLKELSAILDEMLDRLQDMEEQSEEMMIKTKTMLEEIEKFVDRMNVLEENTKTHSLRIDDSNEQRESEVQRLEDMIKELMINQEDINAGLENLQSSHDDLAENVVYKEDLVEAKTEVYDVMESKLKELRKLLREVEDTLVKKEDFMELTARIEELEESKVSRDELGRLLEPGFIDWFLEEMTSLRGELEELKIKVDELEEALNALKTRIEEEILKMMESNLADVMSRLDAIDAKLLRLDPDEINDSFVNLEEQADMIIKDLEELKNISEQVQREAKICFNKIDSFADLLKRLEQMKVDKTKMYELLEQKADIDMLMNKLDRGEFVTVVGEMKDDLERLTITVKINEEEMGQNFLEIRQELALKMYTEDFITATEPIRNRINALRYELKRVKEIALTHLFPDACGITKCISCKRGAHMAGPKYIGDAGDLLQEMPADGSSVKIKTSKSVEFQPDSSETSVPIPPPDKPREKNPLVLPVLFAKARPNIGLAHEKRRSVIDKELADYFATRPVRPIGGEYTKTLPQQRGVTWIKDDQSMEEKMSYLSSLKEPKMKKDFIKLGIRSRRSKLTSKDCVTPTEVSLHVDGEPVQKTETLRKARRNLSLPSDAF